jgi:YD repeat-containing protein
VVQYFYDDAGRIVRKRVIDNTVQETINTRYETEWEYDGMGRIVRERTLQYDSTSDMMVTLRDEHKTYDFGGNVTEIKFYDVDSYAYTLTQTFAQGYQITDFSVSADSSVTSSTSG